MKKKEGWKIKAKIAGHCYMCDGSYAVGDEISWARRGDNAGKVYHTTCKDVEMPHPELPKDEPLTRTALMKPEDSFFYALAEGMVPYFKNKMTDELVDDHIHEIVSAQVQKKVDNYLESRGVTTVRITKQDGKDYDFSGLHHKQYPQVVKLAETDNLWLWGPSGSGKSEMFFRWVEQMGFDQYGFLRLDPATPPSHLVGYMTATGNYVETQFYRCVKYGYPFFIDEVCGGAEALLASLNTIYSNGWATFPNGEPPFRVHPDHRLWVADNTPGRGATTTYHARRAQDGSFIDRFTFVHIEIDHNLEKQITAAHSTSQASLDFLAWVKKVRDYIEENNIPKLMATPRSSFKAAIHIENKTFETWGDMVESLILRGLDHDTKMRLLENNPLPVGKPQP